MRGKANEKKRENTRETVGSSFCSVQTDDSILLSLAWYPGEPQELPSNNIAGKGSVLIPGANVFVRGYWPVGTTCPGCSGTETCYLLPHNCQAAKMAKAEISGTERVEKEQT